MRVRHFYRRHGFGFVLLLIFAAFFSVVLQVRAYTLDEIISYLFPSGLVTSPKGDLVAWAFDEGASFSIMLADAESGRAKEIWKCPNETGGFAQTYPSHSLI